MQESSSPTETRSRSQTLSLIRSSLKRLPTFSNKSLKLEEKCNKIRKRRQSQESNSRSLTESTGNELNSPLKQVAEEDYEINNKFLQHFQILDKIGEGCNACVYKCIHIGTKKPYAVKKIKLQEEHVVRLRKDFITLKEINSPYICKYKGLYFDEAERTAYLVMEYMPFLSLDKHKIKSQKQLKSIIAQILETIEYIHNRNICHRDIKPENILYDPEEEKIKLIDFGISKKTFLRGARRDMLTIIGTHFYLAPEVFLGGGYTETIDLWALGVTIYRLVAGYTPFESEYHSETIANILKGELRFSYSRWSKYSPHLQTFVRQLLKRESERMTLAEAKNHLWLETSENNSPKFRRNSSHSILVNQDFHQEFKNRMINANAKEEGSSIDEDSRIFKKINTLKEKHFNLEDSDDEQTILSPDTKRFRSATMSATPGQSFFAMLQSQFSSQS